MVRLLALASLYLALVGAEPLLSPSVLHEHRAAPPAGWTKTRRHATDATHWLRFGLVQSNLDKLEEYLLEVSNPSSPSYGRHWSAADVVKAFAPSSESVEVVTRWLTAAGVDPSRARLANNKGWVEVNTTVGEAERLLRAKYHVYEHQSGTTHVACDSYHLPEHVSKHVDFVYPTVHFDGALGKRGLRGHGGHSKWQKLGDPGAGAVVPVAKPIVPIVKPSVLSSTDSTPDPALASCSTKMTPLCLKAMYGIDYVPVASDKNSLGIVEYTPQAFVQSDLDYFYGNYTPELVGMQPQLVSIDGGVVQTTNRGVSYNGESNLDIAYAQALVGKQNITLYQVGDLVQGASFNNFLDAIDGSYCTFEGGDDPNYDGIYPTAGGGAGAYNKTQDCGTAPPANVISTSYAYNEVDLSPAYMQRQCREFMKLGLMGVTTLYSSGDHGVAGNSGYCSAQNQGPAVINGKLFTPSFPGSCPYVTAVGATQLPSGKAVTDSETAAYEDFASGGGWSNVFSVPDYQKDVVSAYLTNHKPAYNSSLFNSTAISRAFPDLSANGENFAVVVTGRWYSLSGTSASAPVVGAMLTLINDARIAAGKSPLGFINPAIYSDAFKSAFTDITSGSNPGCGTKGFNATEGWDPVTGLGTPKFPELMKAFLALP